MASASGTPSSRGSRNAAAYARETSSRCHLASTSSRTSSPASARSRRPPRARGRRPEPSASKKADCGFTATTYGPTASTIPLQKRATDEAAAGAPEHRLAAQLHREQIEPRIEPDGKLTALARRQPPPAGRRSWRRPCPGQSYAGEDCGRRRAATTTQLRRRAAQEAGDDEQLVRVLRRERWLRDASAAAQRRPRLRLPARASAACADATLPPATKNARQKSPVSAPERGRRAPARAAGRARRFARRRPPARRVDRGAEQRPRSAGRARVGAASARSGGIAAARDRRRRARRALSGAAGPSACSVIGPSGPGVRGDTTGPPRRREVRGSGRAAPHARWPEGAARGSARSSSSAASSSEPSIAPLDLLERARAQPRPRVAGDRPRSTSAAVTRRSRALPT